MEAGWVGQVEADVHDGRGGHVANGWDHKYEGIEVPVAPGQFVFVLRAVLTTLKPVVHDFEGQQAEHLANEHGHGLHKGMREFPDHPILAR